MLLLLLRYILDGPYLHMQVTSCIRVVSKLQGVQGTVLAHEGCLARVIGAPAHMPHRLLALNCCHHM